MNAAHQKGDARNSCALRHWQHMKQCESAGDDAGYMDARARLCDMFERVSFSYVRHILSNPTLSPDDVIQECRIALLYTIDTWDPDRGELPTLLHFHTRRRVRDYLRRLEIIRRPESVFTRHWQETSQGCQSQETAAIRVHSTSVRHDELLRESICISCPDSDISDQMAATSEDPYESVQTTVAVRQALDYLSAEDRRTVALYFGLDGYEPHTFRGMAPLIGATHQTAKNRVLRALPVLAAALDGIQ